MIFNQPAYFVLLAGAATAFRLLPARAKPWWLFGTGLLFYAYFSPSFVALLLVETVLVFVFAQLAARPGRAGGVAFATGLVAVLGTLVAYKYGALLLRTAALEGLPSFEDLRLPLAISFFTFEFVHYLVDARSRSLPAHSVADFLAFAMFVPTMVAGPIKRFQGFSEQIRTARLSAEDTEAGIRRILTGLAKKVLVADTMTLWIAPLASGGALAEATRLEVAVALIAYSIRIYMDFSGYSDIAIGSARLFGIRVPENFSRPYLRTNIADFWRSWHMSLTRWVTDYVYVPLGGNQRSPARQCLNLLAAMAVSGIWHGAAWNFLGWGLYHGALLSVHRIWRIARATSAAKRSPSDADPRGGDGSAGGRLGDSSAGARLARIVTAASSTALTYSLVTLGWGLFAMPFSRFVDMLQKLVGTS